MNEFKKTKQKVKSNFFLATSDTFDMTTSGLVEFIGKKKEYHK